MHMFIIGNISNEYKENKMKRILLVFSITILLASTLLSNELVKKNQEKVVCKGYYLGEQPPANIPKVFGLGTISTKYGEHSAPSFSPDGKEIFWTSRKDGGGVYYMRMKDNRIWTIPCLAEFSKNIIAVARK